MAFFAAAPSFGRPRWQLWDKSKCFGKYFVSYLTHFLAMRISLESMYRLLHSELNWRHSFIPLQSSVCYSNSCGQSVRYCCKSIFSFVQYFSVVPNQSSMRSFCPIYWRNSFYAYEYSWLDREHLALCFPRVYTQGMSFPSWWLVVGQWRWLAAVDMDMMFAAKLPKSSKILRVLLILLIVLFLTGILTTSCVL